MYYGVDGSLNIASWTIKSKVIDPSLQLGGGYTFLGESSYGTLILVQVLLLVYEKLV
jgi:hypothetical protein